MQEQVKEAFKQIKQLVERVGKETGSDVLVNRIRRKQAITFEIVPVGSPYGPYLRVTESQMRNPVFIQNLLETQAISLRESVEQIQENMKGWEEE